eukprot:COSAG01_NODE_24220_length_786_cov_1.164483_1_plen_43_part_10
MYRPVLPADCAMLCCYPAAISHSAGLWDRERLRERLCERLRRG